MGIILGVAVLGLAACMLGLAAFETTFALLLLTPIAAYPLASALGLGPLSYGLAFATLAGFLFFFTSRRTTAHSSESCREELLPIVFFLLAFSLFSYFCHLWPDFYQLGERLRDFAVLSAVVNSPVQAPEPWLAGYPLNYYLYWYRFGHFLHSVAQLPIWEVYHQLQSFTFALFATSLFVLFRKHARFPVWGAILGSAVICLGSNAEGVYFFLVNDANWWGPSRVIPGAINEFPAWSFLLGDVHPHYLNLGLIPFLIVLFLCVTTSKADVPRKTLIAIGLLTIGTLWAYNANAWEFPAWLGLMSAIFLLLLVTVPRRELGEFYRNNFKSGEGLFTLPSLMLVALIAYLCFSLSTSSLNIIRLHMPPTLVKGAIPRTTALELLRHWGIPLGLIGVGLALSFRKVDWMVLTIFAIACATFSRSAAVLLGLLLVLNAARIYLSRRPGAPYEAFAMSRVVFEALGLIGLLLVLFPEFVFFDDSYGGENERMNTIFKLYSMGWFMLHAFAIYLTARFSREYLERAPEFPAKICVLVCAALMCGFFFRTIKFRKGGERFITPYAQGLSEMERRFAGSASAIQFLASSRPGIVLEAQGPAYDVTTHVSTLASKIAYLGWANHVNLLLRVGDEVGRRTEMTDKIYREADCARKKELVQKESITYVVVGPLERQNYPEINEEQFGCMQQLIKAKEYIIYGIS